MPSSHPLHKALDDGAASIEKASRGTIDYKIYPAQLLGNAFDQYDMVRDRIADVALVVPSYQSSTSGDSRATIPAHET